MSEEPENLVLQSLQEVRADIREFLVDIGQCEQIVAAKSDLNSVGPDLMLLRAEIASDFAKTRNELGTQIDELRREVEIYHSAHLD